jgi:hypothetical protein
VSDNRETCLLRLEGKALIWQGFFLCCVCISVIFRVALAGDVPSLISLVTIA